MRYLMIVASVFILLVCTTIYFLYRNHTILKREFDNIVAYNHIKLPSELDLWSEDTKIKLMLFKDKDNKSLKYIWVSYLIDTGIKRELSFIINQEGRCLLWLEDCVFGAYHGFADFNNDGNLDKLFVYPDIQTDGTRTYEKLEVYQFTNKRADKLLEVIYNIRPYWDRKDFYFVLLTQNQKTWQWQVSLEKPKKKNNNITFFWSNKKGKFIYTGNKTREWEMIFPDNVRYFSLF